MAVHTEEIEELSGYAKEIDDGALPMIYDNLQRTQYMYPVKSTVRELGSNAVDSIQEKLNARAILKGEAKIEDFYAVPETGITGANKDSWFDPNYYDPQWLDLDNNKAQIIYEEGGNTQRDLLRIVDHGVGLGGKRLQGYMKLGYSTKRLSIKQLGKFGIGAKVGLSTGVKFYTTISRYNGREYKFNIYSQNVDSIVPPFDEHGNENPHEIWQRKLKDGTMVDYKVFWTPTTEKNGVEIQVQFRKHYKQDLISAVQSQLLYFDNIEFKVVDINGMTVDYPVQAKVLYEDDVFIISKNTQYSKPHIVINKVAYGYVDFLMLELQDTRGNIGIKVQPHEVDITPSRESVVWEDLTRETIVERFKQAVPIASAIVEKRLQETDFIKWIRACLSTLSRTSGDAVDDDLIVLQELAHIVDTSSLKPTYSPDKSVRFYQSATAMFRGMDIRTITGAKFYKAGTEKLRIERADVKQTSEFGNRPIFVQKGNSNQLKDAYLLTLYPDGFISIRESAEDKIEDDAYWTFMATAQLSVGSKVPTQDEIDEWLKDNKDNYANNVKKILGLFKSSTEIQDYNTVAVPESFKFNEDVEEEVTQDEVVSAPAYANESERRKAEKKIVATTPSFHYEPGAERPFLWHKVEPELDVIDTLTDAELYYGTSMVDEHGVKVEENLIFLATAISRKVERYQDNSVFYHQKYAVDPSTGYYPEDILAGVVELGGPERHIKNYYDTNRASAWYGTPNVRFVKVAQQNMRYFNQHHNHIQEFFLQINNGTVTMSQALIKWNTARLIREHLPKLAFLSNYGIFNATVTEEYKELKEYVRLYYRGLDQYKGRGFDNNEVQELTQHADKVLQLQLFVRENPTDTEGTAELAKALFTAENITGGIAVDMKYYDMLNKLIEYAEPIGVLLNTMGILTGLEGMPISAELETELKFYIKQKRGEL